MKKVFAVIFASLSLILSAGAKASHTFIFVENEISLKFSIEGNNCEFFTFGKNGEYYFWTDTPSYTISYMPHAEGGYYYISSCSGLKKIDEGEFIKWVVSIDARCYSMPVTFVGSVNVASDTKIPAPYICTEYANCSQSNIIGSHYVKAGSKIRCVFEDDIADRDTVPGSGYEYCSVTIDGQCVYERNLDRGSGMNDSIFNTFTLLKTQHYLNYEGFVFETKITTEGNHKIVLEARDNVHNSVKKTFDVYVDSTAPSVRLVNPEVTNVWKKEPVTLKASATDGGSGVKKDSWCWSQDGGKNYGKSSSGGDTAVIKNDGRYDVIFSVSDISGNRGYSSSSKVLIDRVAPVISLSGSTDSVWQNFDYVVAEASDAVSYVDEKSWMHSCDGESYSSGKKISGLKDGKHTVTFLVKDNAGNSAEKTYDVFTDVTLPVISDFSRLTKMNEVAPEIYDETSGIVESSIFWKLDDGMEHYGFEGYVPEGIHWLEFSATDRAGNSRVMNCKVIVDTEPPILEFEIPEYTNRKELDVVDFEARDLISENINVTYAIDEREFADFSDSQGWKKSVNVFMLPEGMHRISVKADDCHFNEVVKEKTFVLDRTCPVLYGVRISSGDEVSLDKGDLICVESEEGQDTYKIHVSLDGKDFCGDTQCGQIRTWQMAVNNGEYIEFDGSEFDWSEFIEGQNEFKFRIVDMAGNVSNELSYYLIKDSSVPLAPAVSSFTHPRAFSERDTVRTMDAGFSIRSVSLDDNGIKGFLYGLYTCSLNQDGSIDYSSMKIVEGYEERLYRAFLEDTVYYPNLVDNDVGKFYCFRSRILSTNYLKSDYTDFVFRVDSKAPEKFDMWITPQIDSNVWYNNPNVCLNWNKGRDNSEIAKLIYSIGGESWDTIGSIDSREKWVKVDDCTEISMRSVDIAGNYAERKASVKIDTRSPYFDDFTLGAEWKGKKLKKQSSDKSTVDSVYVTWGKFFDDDSGPDCYKLEVECLDGSDLYGSKYFYYSVDKQNCVLFGVNDNFSYLIKLSALDKAGNMVTKTRLLLSKYYVPGEKLSFDYSYSYNGIDFCGKASINPQTEEISFESSPLLICDNFFSYELNPSTVVFDGASIIFAESSHIAGDEKKFLQVGGIEFSFRDIHFDAAYGISLYDVTCVQGEELEVSFPYVSIGFPSKFLPYGSSNGFECAELKTDWFDFKNVERIVLHGDEKEIGVSVCIQSKHGVLFGDDDDFSRISDGILDLSDSSSYGSLGHGCKIKLKDGPILNVAKGWFYGEIVTIEESFFDFVENGEIFHCKVNSFSYDDKLDAFLTEKISFEITDANGNIVKNFYTGGVNISSQDFSLSGDGVLSCLGYVDSQDLLLQINGIGVSETGFDFDSCELDPFTVDILGYDVIVLASEFIKDDASGRIRITSGLIKLFHTEYSISNLMIDAHDYNRVYEGCLLEDFNTNPGYGTGVGFSSVVFSKEGIVCTVSVPMPLSNEVLIFDKSIILSDGRLRAEINESTIVKSWNTDFQFDWVCFDGKNVSCSGFIDSSNMNLYESDGDKQHEKLFFTNLMFGYNSINSEGSWLDDGLIYRHGNFICPINYLAMGINGLVARCFINQFFEIEKGMIHFDLSSISIVLRGNGFMECINDDSKGYVEYLGRKYIVEKPILAIEERIPVVKGSKVLTLLFDDNGFNFIECGETYFDSFGHVHGEEYEQNVIFTSSNGIKINIFEAVINSEGLCVSGKIFIEKVKGHAYSMDHIFNINPDGVLISIDKLKDFNFELFGFDIRGENLSIGKDGFALDNILVPWRNTSLKCGRIAFDRNFIPVDCFDYTVNENTDFILPDSTIVNLRCDYAGFNVDCVVHLPAYMGNGDIYIEGVKIHPDGKEVFSSGLSSFTSHTEYGSFELKDIIYSPDCLFAGELKIRQETQIGSLDLTLYSVCIDYKNELHSRGMKSDAFTLGECLFFMESFYCGPEGLSFSGYGQLKNELPGILSGKLFTVKDMLIGWDGVICNLDAYTPVYSEIPLKDDWGIFCDIGRIRERGSHFYLELENAILKFPPQFIVNEVSLNGICYDINLKDFDFSKITTNGIISFGGLSFCIESLEICRDYAINFYGSVEFAGSGFPGFLRGKKTHDSVICVLPNGEIDHIDVRIEELNGFIEYGVTSLLLKNGTMDVIYDGSSCRGKVSGIMGISEDCDDNLSLLDIPIEVFEYDLIHHEIIELVARNEPTDGGFRKLAFENLSAIVHWTSESVRNISLVGDLILPSYIPKGLADEAISMDSFLINNMGEVIEFSAEKGYVGAFNYSNGISVFDPELRVDFITDKPRIFIGGKIILEKENFPEGIGGISADCSLEFDNIGLLAFESSGIIPDSLIFGNIFARNLSFSFNVSDYEGFVDFSGDLCFSDSQIFPESISGLNVHFDEIRFALDGTLLNLDALVRVSDFTLFDSVEVSEAIVEFLPGNKRNEILLSVSANARVVNPYVPQSLRKSYVAVKKLLFSSISGLDEFNISVEGGIDFTVLGGLKIFCDSLILTDEGFSCSAIAYLNFYGPMKDTRINLKKFLMDWNGKVKEIDGGLAYTKVDIAGFTGSIKSLYFVKDSSCQDGFSVNLEQCMIQLPVNMGSGYVAIRNAMFKNGKFYGQLDISNIDMWICGFRLIFRDPFINFDKMEIGFSHAYVEFPTYLSSGSAEIFNARISSKNGLILDGVSFSIPSLSIGGNGFGFRDLRCVFIKNGNSFLLSGTGKANIPNICEIEAEVSFTNVSSAYPIGLKRGYFGFEIKPPRTGIPLGSTGLFISGARGGLAFGPPEEVPEKIRSLYKQKNGMRVQLGITISDKTGGDILSMKPDTWVDISNFTWGMYGRTNVLRSTFNFTGDTYALLHSYGFYTGMNIDFIFIDGNIQASVSKHGGSTKMSGSASARIRIEKGDIKTFKIGLWKFKKKIYIPPFSAMTPELNTQFGHFTNGKVGFKASVNFFGFNFGVFVSKSGVKIGNVSDYKVYEPMKDMSFDLDLTSRDIESTVSVIPYSLDFRKTGCYSSEIFIEKNVGDFSLLCAYVKGDPWIKLRSPDGFVYSCEAGNMNALQMEDSRLFTIQNPVPGKYTLDIENADMDSLFVSSIFTPRIPLIELSDVLNLGEELNVVGRSDISGINLYFELTDEDMPGVCVELGTCMVSEDGCFDEKLSLSGISNGKYFLEVRADMGNDFMSNPVIWNREIIVSHDESKCTEPINLIVFEDEDCNPEIIWEDMNGSRASGHLIKIEDIEKGDVYIINPGFLTRYKFIEGKKGRHLKYSVCACNSSGTPLVWSDSVDYICGEEKKEENIPYGLKKTISVNCLAGNVTEFVIDASIHNLSEDRQYMYVSAAQITEYDGNTLCSFPDEVEIMNEAASIPGKIIVSSDCPAGKYYINVKIYNKGNINLYDVVEVEAIVSEEQLSIDRIYPAEIDGTKQNIVWLTGRGFAAGTRFYLEDEELCVRDLSPISDSLVPLHIPEQESGGEKLIRAVSPSGIDDLVPIEIGIPSYSVSSHPAALKSGINSKVFIPIWIDRKYGYEKPISIVLAEEIQGMEFDIPACISGNNAIITLYVLENCIPGKKEIKFACDNGVDFIVNLLISESNEFDAPEINFIYPETAVVGDMVSIYGNGFSPDSEVFLNDELVWPISYGLNLISFKVSPEMKTGYIYVKKGHQVSNTKILYIKERYLNVELEKNKLFVYPNSEYRVPFRIKTSSNDGLKYECICDGENISSSIAENSDIVGDKYILIKTGDMVPGNECSLVFRVYDGKYYCESVVEISVALSRYVDVSNLYTGRTGIEYFAQVNAFGFNEGWHFENNENNLPLGLNCTPEGIIYGVPLKAGSYEFTLTINDGEHVESKNCFISIIDDELSMKDSDPGRSNSFRFLNESRIVDEHAFLEDHDIWLYSGERYYIANEKELQCYDNKDQLVWTYKCEKKIIDMVISGNGLFIYLESGDFYVFDRNGKCIRKFNDVRYFHSCDDHIVLRVKERIVKINSWNLTLMPVNQSDYIYVMSKGVYLGNNLYSWTDNLIRKIDTNHSMYVYDSKIVSCIGSGRALYCICEKGIKVLNEDLEIICEKEIDSIALTSWALVNRKLYLRYGESEEYQIVDFSDSF